MDYNFRFHHLGIATRSIEKYVEIYIKFGYSASKTIIEPSQNVKISFLSKSGSPSIELVQPLVDDSPISRILQQLGTTPYHICYEVDDIQQASDALEDLNFRPLFEPMESEAMDKGFFCYFFSVDIGLIELYQRGDLHK